MEWITQMEVVNRKWHNHSETVSASSDLSDRKKYSKKLQFRVEQEVFTYASMLTSISRTKLWKSFMSCSTTQQAEAQTSEHRTGGSSSSVFLSALTSPSCPLSQPHFVHYPASLCSWSLCPDHQKTGPRRERLVCSVAAGGTIENCVPIHLHLS